MIGFYGDDFTGSVDALLQLRRAGIDGALVTDPAEVEGIQAAAVGIAGTARSLRTDDIEAEVRPAFEALRRAGCDVVLYKVCSTADSSPFVGSIGRAIEVGRDVFGASPVPVLFAQPDFGRWTVFSTHFARQLDVVHRLDRHPTMAHHPSTPMLEADLRVHLAAQTDLSVAAVDILDYADGPERVATRIAEGGDVVVLDALSDEHLTLVGRAILQHPGHRFVVGSGGLALGIGRALGGSASPLPTAVPPSATPVLVVSGSCSPLSWTQAQTAIDAGWVGVPALDDDAPGLAAAAYASGRNVVAYSASGSSSALLPPADIAARLGAVVREVVSCGAPTRIVIAGGDTSGEVLRILGAQSLSIVATPWGNLPLLRVAGGDLDGVEVVLKGGQVGTPDAYLAIALGRAS